MPTDDHAPLPTTITDHDNNHDHDQAGPLSIAITGGTSGLGLALVRRLRADGAAVAFVSRTAADVERVAAETGAIGIVGDVGDKADIHPIALQLLDALGRIDVVINNASTLGPVPLVPLADTECEDLEAALAVNLLGPFRLTKALLGALAESARNRRGGVVVNISSDAAVTPYPTWGAYGASKAALAHLSAIWNSELTDIGIRVVSIDPGDMDTPLHALADPDADPADLLQPGTAAARLLATLAPLLDQDDGDRARPAAATDDGGRS